MSGLSNAEELRFGEYYASVRPNAKGENKLQKISEDGPYINTMNATGSIKARRVVVTEGRTKVMSRFLTINVLTCLKKRFMVFAIHSLLDQQEKDPMDDERMAFL